MATKKHPADIATELEQERNYNIDINNDHLTIRSSAMGCYQLGVLCVSDDVKTCLRDGNSTANLSSSDLMTSHHLR